MFGWKGNIARKLRATLRRDIDYLLDEFMEAYFEEADSYSTEIGEWSVYKSQKDIPSLVGEEEPGIFAALYSDINGPKSILSGDIDKLYTDELERDLKAISEEILEEGFSSQNPVLFREENASRNAKYFVTLANTTVFALIGIDALGDFTGAYEFNTFFNAYLQTMIESSAPKAVGMLMLASAADGVTGIIGKQVCEAVGKKFDQGRIDDLPFDHEQEYKYGYNAIDEITDKVNEIRQGEKKLKLYEKVKDEVFERGKNNYIVTREGFEDIFDDVLWDVPEEEDVEVIIDKIKGCRTSHRDVKVFERVEE